MPQMPDTDWRPAYSERFLARAIQRPPRPRPYAPLTDEQIEALPESMRPMARVMRDFNEAMSVTAARIAETMRRRP